jgi:glucose/galactose transporter
MIILSGLFFIFGFVTWLNGMLIPYLKIACELSDFQALFVTFAFYISYTVMALPSSYILDKIGFKKGMVLGLWVMAIGTLIFIPAAMTRTYLLFLTGLFVMGSGLALLQTASNPYVTVIGPKESAARRISILGVCNKLAGAIAPLLLAYFVFSDADTFVQTIQGMNAADKSIALDGLALRVIYPYLVMTVSLIIMGVAVFYSSLPSIDNEEEKDENSSKKHIWAFPHLILGVIALFLYVGVEVIAGDTIIRYGLSLGIKMETAKAFTSYTLLCMLVGYFIGIACIPKYISQAKALKFSAFTGILFTLGAIYSTGITSVVFIALLGLANALVWPAIWPLSLDGLGKFLSKGSALLIMSIAGGAILPLAWGYMSDSVGSQQAYWIMIPAYLFILFYAIRGYKLRSWK